MTHQIQVLNVEGSKMEVFVFEPGGKVPFPGLVQCMHIPVGHKGIENDEFTLKTAKRYQDNGYVVVVPFIFHWWPKSAEIEIKRDEFRDDWTKLDLDASFNLISEMLIQRGLAYLDIAGEEESVGSVLELTPSIRRVPFFMEEESKKQWEKTILLLSTLLPISYIPSLVFSATKTRILPLRTSMTIEGL